MGCLRLHGRIVAHHAVYHLAVGPYLDPRLNFSIHILLSQTQHSNTNIMANGSCLCGDVKYTFTGAPVMQVMHLLPSP